MPKINTYEVISIVGGQTTTFITTTSKEEAAKTYRIILDSKIYPRICANGKVMKILESNQILNTVKEANW